MAKQPDCCKPVEKKGTGLLAGILYGLAPHTFCIAFIVLSVVGATAAAGLLRQVLLVPYLFQILIGLSFTFATLSAVIYLRRLGALNLSGARRRWRYLAILYSTTVAVNLVLFLVVFPAFANGANRVQAAGLPGAGQVSTQPIASETAVLQVSIPCSGHASLITNDLLKQQGVLKVQYDLPDRFSVDYNPNLTSPATLLQAEIFKEFPAKLVQ
ncbi:MAG: hypothetical protein ACYC6L_16945 [Anaerolineae bacterium]